MREKEVKHREAEGETLERPWAVSASEVLRRLNVDPKSGLSGEEVALRRNQYGPNALEKAKRRSVWAIFVDQVKNLIVILLSLASGLAFAFGQWLDGVAVLIALAINVLIGFTMELKATRSMAALQRMTKTRAKVMRGKDTDEMDAEAIVPGDIVVLSSGDMVPADLRLIESNRIQVNESALTGESVPVSKSTDQVDGQAVLAERSNMVFKGTALTMGSGHGVATATGMRTEIGRISEMAEEAEAEETPLERRLNRLGQRLIWVVVGVGVLIGLNGWFRGMDMVLAIKTAIALAVAAIPEGLPIVATVALARGMWRMAERNALMNRLSAVETLGSTSVIFADKTGTLTENRMRMRTLALGAGDGRDIAEATLEGGRFAIGGEGVAVEDQTVLRAILEAGVLCNNAELDKEENGEGHVGDPVEIGLLQAGRAAGMSRDELLERMPEVGEEAFDQEKARMATWHKSEDGFLVAVKGSPESILSLSSRVLGPDGEAELTDELRDKWLDKNFDLASRGLRVLAAARKFESSRGGEAYSDLTFLGLYGLLDPPREGIGEVIEQLHRAGIEVVMVTGDQPLTAKQIGESIGLANKEQEVVSGKDLGDLKNLSAEKKERLLGARIFSRVTPGQKLRLVSLFQEGSRVVAMTGDGVNDAPALKKADIGVAMGKRGTDVAREASDMVLKDDSFATIAAAVEQGRVIFSNIRKFIVYLLSGNAGGILIVATAILAGMPLPLLPLQILYLNMLSDVFPALALGVGSGTRAVMDDPPRKPGEPIVTGVHWAAVGIYGVLIAGAVLTSFWLALNHFGMAEERAVTVSFLTLAFARQWHVFNMRDLGSSFLVNGITRNPWVWGALVLCFGLLLAAVYLPYLSDALRMREPGRTGWLLIIGMSLVPAVLIQPVKSFIHDVAGQRSL
jgi:P-type Ca2+ transporter type 2C